MGHGRGRRREREPDADAVRGQRLAAAGAAAAADKVVYRVGWTREPDNLSPFVGYAAPSFEIWYLTYDSLVGYDPKTLAPTKGEDSTGLATDWSVSDDGLTWTFTIRKNAKWSDGVPLTAKDVAFTYNYIIKNQLDTLTAYTRLIKEAVAVDDYTVKMICSKPKPDMIHSWVPILPEHIWSTVDPKQAASGKYTNNPPSWAPAPSRPWSGRRPWTSSWSRTRPGGARSRRSMRSTSSPTPTTTRCFRTCAPAPSTPASISPRPR